MAAANTYELIASHTFPSAASSFTFSNIPQTYDTIHLIASVLPNGGNVGLSLRFNGDTAASYSATAIYQSDGATASSSRDTNATSIALSWFSSATTNDYMMTDAYLHKYTATDMHKHAIVRTGTYTRGIARVIGKYQSNSAVTSITIISGNAFAIGSTVHLYGIKKA